MMANPKFTPWFPGTTKPAYPGVYQQQSLGSIGYQRWDGKLWFSWYPTVDQALLAKNAVRESSQDDDWRGLAQKPKTWVSAERRPGLTQLVEQLKCQHPTWSWERCVAQAKASFT